MTCLETKQQLERPLNVDTNLLFRLNVCQALVTRKKIYKFILRFIILWLEQIASKIISLNSVISNIVENLQYIGHSEPKISTNLKSLCFLTWQRSFASIWIRFLLIFSTIGCSVYEICDKAIFGFLKDLIFFSEEVKFSSSHAYFLRNIKSSSSQMIFSSINILDKENV